MFYNIPNIDAFIRKITARCVGKIVRSKDTTLSKNPGSRDFKVQKTGAPQLTCNNNFTKVIDDILPHGHAL
jgi:hypothetical protein